MKNVFVVFLINIIIMIKNFSKFFVLKKKNSIMEKELLFEFQFVFLHILFINADKIFKINH